MSCCYQSNAWNLSFQKFAWKRAKPVTCISHFFFPFYMFYDLTRLQPTPCWQKIGALLEQEDHGGPVLLPWGIRVIISTKDTVAQNGHGGHLAKRTETIWINFPSNPSRLKTKYDYNWPSGFTGEVIWICDCEKRVWSHPFQYSWLIKYLSQKSDTSAFKSLWNIFPI